MKIKATTADAYNLFHNGVLALARAERQGIRIDLDYCYRKRKHLTKKISYYHKKMEGTNLYRRWGHIYKNKTNIHSDHQLSNILYTHMKIEPPKLTEAGKGATDEETLKQIELPELKYILQIRKLTKIRDTYLGQFIRETNKDGYIRPSFNLHNVRTYRSSSANPNFQNIPKRDKEAMETCRRAILPRPGHMLVEADFSALEVMISACYHKDPVMMKYLESEADMHLDMAKQIFMMEDLDKGSVLRKAAKNGFVFPQFYGDYYGNNARGLCEWAGLPTKKGWKDVDGVELANGENIGAHMRRQGTSSFIQFVEHMKKVEEDFWGRRFKVYNEWRKSWVEKYRKRGYLRMLTGFACSGIMKKNEIINYPIQGTAFHCLLFTFIELDKIMRKEEWNSKLVGQIHDSIVMDVDPQELSRIKEVLNRIVEKELPKQWGWITVPLEIEVDEYGIDQPWIEM